MKKEKKERMNRELLEENKKNKLNNEFKLPGNSDIINQ